jgi:hypothetical protein
VVAVEAVAGAAIFCCLSGGEAAAGGMPQRAGLGPISGTGPQDSSSYVALLLTWWLGAPCFVSNTQFLPFSRLLQDLCRGA